MRNIFNIMLDKVFVRAYNSNCVGPRTSITHEKPL